MHAYTRLPLSAEDEGPCGGVGRAAADLAADAPSTSNPSSVHHQHRQQPRHVAAGVTARHHRRCRSQGAAAYYAPPSLQDAASHASHHQGFDHLDTIPSASGPSDASVEDSICAAVAQQQQQQQHAQHHAQSTSHPSHSSLHAGASYGCGGGGNTISAVHARTPSFGWQQPQRAAPCRAAAAGRHKRSASLGPPSSAASLAGGGAGGIGPWWTGPQGHAGGGPPCSAPHHPLDGGGGGGPGGAGLTSAGSFLHLGSWGGALGTLVAESLGTRRPSFCLDPAALARHASSRAPSRAASSAGCLLPTCLICLDALNPEDFESGEAITQACACKGDVALRHRRCAVQWSAVKRSTVCDVCRAPIANLPELPPDTSAGGAGGGPDGPGGEAWDNIALGNPPGLSDYLIDAVRVMWMSLVLCILFFNMPVTKAFVIGGVVGVVLTAAAHALVMAQRSAAAVRAFAGALRERAWAQGRQQQLQMGQGGAPVVVAAAGGGRWGWGLGAAAAPAAISAEPGAAPAAAAHPTATATTLAGSTGASTSGAAAPTPRHGRAPSSTVLWIEE
jgi:hypothetical protein